MILQEWKQSFKLVQTNTGGEKKKIVAIEYFYGGDTERKNWFIKEPNQGTCREKC